MNYINYKGKDSVNMDLVLFYNRIGNRVYFHSTSIDRNIIWSLDNANEAALVIDAIADTIAATDIATTSVYADGLSAITSPTSQV